MFHSELFLFIKFPWIFKKSTRIMSLFQKKRKISEKQKNCCMIFYHAQRQCVPRQNLGIAILEKQLGFGGHCESSSRFRAKPWWKLYKFSNSKYFLQLKFNHIYDACNSITCIMKLGKLKIDQFQYDSTVSFKSSQVKSSQLYFRHKNS